MVERNSRSPRTGPRLLRMILAEAQKTVFEAERSTSGVGRGLDQSHFSSFLHEQLHEWFALVGHAIV